MTFESTFVRRSMLTLTDLRQTASKRQYIHGNPVERNDQKHLFVFLSILALVSTDLGAIVKVESYMFALYNVNCEQTLNIKKPVFTERRIRYSFSET